MTDVARGIRFRTHEPGDIGWIVQQHGALYAAEYGWSDHFEALVADIGAEFLRNYDPNRERCWIAELGDQPVGSVMVVKHPDDASVAKLRLLLVHPSARGHGLGKQLVRMCLDFARACGYRRMVLWTNAELSAARGIYASAGFTCTAAEDEGSPFGKPFVSETWTCDL